MPVISFRMRVTVYVLLYLVGLLLWCEFFLYYFHLAATCSWPEKNSPGTLNALVLSDTHLLGTIRGHWFDKLRREWQMYRSFQTALTLFSPKLIFILGDIFDEGQFASSQDFDSYVNRFKSIFDVPSNCQLYVVTGNHDIGFHYRTHSYLYGRFDRAMNTSTVDYLTFPNNIYVIRLNSMAMENDGCSLCNEAMIQIEKLSKKFHQLRQDVGMQVYPVLLTHFPMFRLNESICDDEDAVPPEEKFIVHRPGFDCFSKKASDYLLDRLKPRLILNGHVHHSCRVNHTVNSEGNSNFGKLHVIPEWTVASFSWRNKADPSFLLLQLTNSSHSIHKCFLPNENFLILTYVFAIGTPIILIAFLLTLAKIKRKDD